MKDMRERKREERPRGKDGKESTVRTSLIDISEEMRLTAS